MTKTLLLLLILLLAGFMAFIPHIGYAYPLHVDEWTHLTYAKTVAGTGSIIFPDPFTGQATSGTPGNNVALGFYLLWAIVQQVSGIDWMLIFRFGPSLIFMLTVLCVYIFANKHGYGLEAAFFTCLIPTTGGLLGPAFMVPMALGLLFIPLSLYIAFYVKSWPSYILLFLIACFLWLMHPTTAAIQGIVLLPFILITIKVSPMRSLGILAALGLPIFIALPFTYRQLLPAAGQLLSPKEIFPPPYLDLPAVLLIYGFIPLIFCFVGIIYLLKRGGRFNYGLLLALVLLLVVMLAFARFQVGMDTIFLRGVSTALILIGITAGAGLYWLRTQTLYARFLVKHKPHVAAYTGGLLCALAVAVTLALAIPSRCSVPYYHMVDDEDYRAFTWIKDNIGVEYDTALIDPWIATAFTAVTGKKIVSRIWTKQETADEIIYKVMASESLDMAFIIDNRVSFIYNRLGNSNPNLINIRKNVYITNPNISEQFVNANLLKNAGFEAIYGAPPMHWFQFSNNCVTTFLFEEKGGEVGDCIGINITGAVKPEARFYAGYGQAVNVQAGKSYNIGGWIRTENIADKQGTKIVAHWVDAAGQHIFDSSAMDFMKGTNEWTHYQGTVIAPPGATSCIAICLMEWCTGTARFDEIVFKPE